MSERLTKVRLLGRFQRRGGAVYNAGECVALPPDAVEELLAAVPPQAVVLEAAPAAKAPAGPPADKMVKHSQAKGGRR